MIQTKDKFNPPTAWINFDEGILSMHEISCVKLIDMLHLWKHNLQSTADIKHLYFQLKIHAYILHFVSFLHKSCRSTLSISFSNFQMFKVSHHFQYLSNTLFCPHSPYQLSLILNSICTHSSNVFCPQCSKVFSAKHLYSSSADPENVVQARLDDHQLGDFDNDVSINFNDDNHL